MNSVLKKLKPPVTWPRARKRYTNRTHHSLECLSNNLFFLFAFQLLKHKHVIELFLCHATGFSVASRSSDSNTLASVPEQNTDQHRKYIPLYTLNNFCGFVFSQYCPWLLISLIVVMHTL